MLKIPERRAGRRYSVAVGSLVGVAVAVAEIVVVDWPEAEAGMIPACRPGEAVICSDSAGEAPGRIAAGQAGSVVVAEEHGRFAEGAPDIAGLGVVRSWACRAAGGRTWSGLRVVMWEEVGSSAAAGLHIPY